MIKKILKKKVWDIIAQTSKSGTKQQSQSVNEDWTCIKRGLMIYFGNKNNWSKDLYRIWKDYVSERVKEEMMKESSEVHSFVQAHSKSK